jgi:hypothetical protein
MKYVKGLLTILAVVAIILGIGFFIPISISSTQGCENQNTPVVKLHWIKGESIEKAKKENPKGSSCSDSPSYLLYIL